MLSEKKGGLLVLAALEKYVSRFMIMNSIALKGIRALVLFFLLLGCLFFFPLPLFIF